MGVRIEAPPIGKVHPRGGVIVAVVATLVVGSLAGALVTRVIDRTETKVGAATAATAWDAGKLEAMEGRQQAAALADQDATRVVPWDVGKLEAMKGLQRAAERAAAEVPATVDDERSPLERHRLAAKFK